MYVCICCCVTDDQIRREVGNGACSLSELSRRLGVATCCGRCRDCAETLIAESLDQTSADAVRRVA